MQMACIFISYKPAILTGNNFSLDFIPKEPHFYRIFSNTVSFIFFSLDCIGHMSEANIFSIICSGSMYSVNTSLPSPGNAHSLSLVVHNSLSLQNAFCSIFLFLPSLLVQVLDGKDNQKCSTFLIRPITLYCQTHHTSTLQYINGYF